VRLPETGPSPASATAGSGPGEQWRRWVVYQIYPRSFADSDADGVGDLRGILAHLDHLERLGVDVVWLSPFYRSPMDDNGYDIRDTPTSTRCSGRSPIFSRKQPDLNWENPEVRQAVPAMMRWWLDRGVDGSAWTSST
jgi:glycosidase